MREPLLEYAADMAVRQGIVDYLPLPPEFHQIGQAQRFELVRYRRFGHAEQNRQIAHAHFLAVERPQNLYAGAVRKHLVEVGEVEKIARFWHEAFDLVHDFLMDDAAVARRLFDVFHF